MGSARQPLGASSNASTTQHTQTRDAAALTGANLAFLKSLPPQEALRFLQKRSPPPLPAEKKAHVAHSILSSSAKRPSPPTTRKPSSLTASLAAARAPPSVTSLPGPAPVRSVSRASIQAAENVYSPSPSPSPSPSSSRAPTPSVGRKSSPPSWAKEIPPGTVSIKRAAPAPIVVPKRASPEKLDQSSIAPTTSLVEMFERKESSPPIKSPKPLRKTPILRGHTLPPIMTRLEQGADDSSSDESFTSARDHLSPDQPSKPALPPTRRSAQRADSKLQVPVEPAIRVQPPSRSISMQDAGALPVPSPSPSQLSASPATKPLPIPRQPSPNPQSITAAYHQLHPRRMTPLSGDSLANAIVASSLASSRAPSPMKLPQPAQGRRTSHGSFFSRTPSPPKKGMRHTMRKASDSESEEDEDPYSKHKKKRFVRKHPNKHHEGDRKRWRDAVTQRERKRYEGVWAANKGIFVEYTAHELAVLAAHPNSKESERLRVDVAEQVADLVARDIWTRSRLPAHELGQVWDLVDTQQVGRLLRDEFVVGLWLIDQRLKGRKLPVKVTDSVWNSVRLLSGIKLRKA